MRISWLTIGNLGVKLYGKVSAIVAKLIANAYDADTTRVTHPSLNANHNCRQMR